MEVHYTSLSTFICILNFSNKTFRMLSTVIILFVTYIYAKGKKVKKYTPSHYYVLNNR